MMYYKVEKDGRITGITQSDYPLKLVGFSEITEEEFLALGGIPMTQQRTIEDNALNIKIQTLSDRGDSQEDAMCALDVAYDGRIAAIENALCELDKGVAE